MAEATNQAPKDLIGFLDYYLVQKAPFQIPDAGRELIVKIGPWVLLVLIVLTLPFVLMALGIGTVAIPFGGPAYAGSFTFAVLTTIVWFGLSIAALPGLFARKRSGWNLLFYSQLVSIATSLISFQILGAVVGGLIGLYLMFQVRTLYQ
jgi:hypothetical protein